MSSNRNFLIILIISLFQITVFPQVQRELMLDQNSPKRIMPVYKPGGISNTFHFKDSLIVKDIDMKEMIDVIVEFKEAPLFTQMQEKGLKKISLESFRGKQAALSSAVFQLHRAAEKVYNTTFNVPVKHQEYYKLFNGAAMTIPRAILSDIASLDYVKKIHLAKKFSVNMQECVKIIGADSVWAKYGNKGDSVVVGIIDTGIDYLHPALGGGIGKGFKVIGGYDFVNKDNDPMDDHDHGTHVAGIIAGKTSTFSGVAPNALLFAIKVIGANGYGEEADILSGIERAADPNDDNNYDDKVDIANMSLGGDGAPDDPLCTAVNNAVKLGVVFCISAGNSGSFKTIGSPGMADLAITVGATDKSDMIADFSSKGPNEGNYAIKPDILAPGVYVNSSVIGGGYESFSGTSMASPMVAGVCALLKKQHKDWTPQMFKSAIMTSAKDLGLSPYEQGSGRVQAQKAINVSTFANPSSISFGNDKINEPVWSVNDTVIITNKNNIAQNYTVAVSGVSGAFSLGASPSSLYLLPGESKPVVFSLVVDNKKLADVMTPPYSYFGKVKITGTNDVIILPWAFAKYSAVTISFDKPYVSCFVFNKENSYFFYVDSTKKDLYKTKFEAPPGLYQIWTSFSSVGFGDKGEGEDVRVFKDSVEIKGYKEISINSSEAVNKITFKGVDENGRLLSLGKNSFNNILLMNDNASGFESLILSAYSLPAKFTFKFNDISNNIKVKAGQYQSSLVDEHRIRVMQYPVVSGVHKDITFINKPNDFMKQNIEINLSPEKKYTNAYFMNIASFGDGAVGRGILSDLITDRKWNGELYISPETENDLFLTAEIQTDTAIDYSLKNVFFDSGVFRTKGDSIGLSGFTFDIDQNCLYPANSNFILGDGPIALHHFALRNKKEYFFGLNYRGQFGEMRYSDNYYTSCSIFDKDKKLIKSGNLYDINPFWLDKGVYSAQFRQSNYFVNKIRGTATLNFDILMDNLPNYGPSLYWLKVLNSKNIPVSRFDKGENGKIAFKISSFTSETTDASILVKKHKETQWTEIKKFNSIQLLNDNTWFSADISNVINTDTTLMDLKIILINKGPNMKTEWILEPAFIVGDYIENVEADSTRLSSLPKQFALYSNYPNPFNPSTVISYALPRSSNVTLKVYDMMGREVTTLVNKAQEAGHHTVQFDASKLSSGVYFYTIKADIFISSRKMLLVK